MGKNKFWTSVAIGAIVGGLVALVDRDTRHYAANKLSDLKTGTSYCITHPSDTVRRLRMTVGHYNDAFMANADQAINALEQVEDTIDKFQSKRDNFIEVTE
ncbi:YtxH domain-containing protein [Lentibacillus saliphilus]|uniref:YtxH domain-containing protein n=1 Tax=Lentibacillus saliphilus TaxID=2737028 RepID=UPI001C302714|nr:YtxH domain-containing protein [Lentibacillus saliphilus]